MKNILLAVASVAAFAADVHAAAPYTGQQTRDIKALAAEEVKGHLNGDGLGYAKAAELNHYPGPRHVLDMAKELSLTEEQTIRTQAIFDSMKKQATDFGKQLVEKERELDRQFATESIGTDSLKTLLSDIGRLQAEIRFVHLRAHLEQKALLAKHQIMLYDQRRGYGASSGSGPHHAH